MEVRAPFVSATILVVWQFVKSDGITVQFRLMQRNPAVVNAKPARA